MDSGEKIKQVVKEKYGEIAKQGKMQSSRSCCCPDSSSGVDYSIFSEDYSKVEGYNPDADLGLGCGIPTESAKIKPGDTVLDLGSGAGMDAFVARRIVGESGLVIGVDMTESMIEKARENNQKLGYKNVEFRFGEIENLPVSDSTVDMVISNCVLNLVPDKFKAYQEIYRVLKPGGHFSISDVVLMGDLPPAIQSAAEMHAGCVAGALKKDHYLSIIKRAGFSDTLIVKEKPINIPDNMLSKYLSDDALQTFKNAGPVILSITVYAEKPQQYKERCSCCG